MDNLPPDYLGELPAVTENDPYEDVTEALCDLIDLSESMGKAIGKTNDARQLRIFKQGVDEIVSRLNLYLEQ
jgi:hypothetical protein